MSGADLRGVLSAAGFGSAIWFSQPHYHNHDHRGYRWCHDTVGHRLQRGGPYQSGHGENIAMKGVKMMFFCTFTTFVE